jgi:hypothetical protein
MAVKFLSKRWEDIPTFVASIDFNHDLTNYHGQFLTDFGERVPMSFGDKVISS